MKNNIEIICPLFNAEKYLLSLNDSIRKQKNVNVDKITYILTESNDRTEKILKENKIPYEKETRSKFSHSLTREKYALKSNASILVFITQDIKIKELNWLEELVKPIIENEAEATYSRQICNNNKSIEKYTREFNYPAKDELKTKSDIKEKNLKTFFFSDASSAIETSIFKKLNGYDGKNLSTNEDMYIAFKIIMNGYRIKYCSKSIAIHYHNQNLKELWNRYAAIGNFFKMEKELKQFKQTKSGKNMATYIFKKALKEKNTPVLKIFIPNMTVRFLATKIGKKIK